ncbi:F-box/LRR-repeat protein 2-like, partial [Scleropages formosus]
MGIFSYLDVVTLCRCAQVSKAWNILALDGSNWQKIDLFNFQTDIEGRVVENISKRCGGFLRQLSLRGCLSVGDASMKTFAQNCRNIEHLNLNGCTKITDSTCISLSKFCSKLRHLDLTSCVSITNHSLKALSEGCRGLENLNISWCDQITRDGVEALVRGCGGLKALFLRGCTQLDDEALKHLQKHCPELVTINVQSCTVTDEGLVGLCRGCHKLQTLCISGCSNITDASLTALGLNCPRLKILEAARCSHVTDAGFAILARNCHELEKMDLEECILLTDNTLLQLSIHCPRLQALSLSHCELITDDGIRHLSGSVCGQERLQVVELDNCPLITDLTLEHLKSCHRLERIELYDCQQVTRAGIKRIRVSGARHRGNVSDEPALQVLHNPLTGQRLGVRGGLCVKCESPLALAVPAIITAASCPGAAEVRGQRSDARDEEERSRWLVRTEPLAFPSRRYAFGRVGGRGGAAVSVLLAERASDPRMCGRMGRGADDTSTP